MPLIIPKPIETPRMWLRLIEESDLPGLLEIIGDDEVTRFLGFSSWKTMVDAEAWFRRISAMQTTGSAREFVIVAKQTGNILGRCGLFEFEEVDAHAGLGYILGRPHWKQGYMREALTALIDCAFHEMSLRRLEARVEAHNTASTGLLQRLGFTKEGVLRERWMNKAGPMDAEIYGLLRNEWLRHKLSDYRT